MSRELGQRVSAAGSAPPTAMEGVKGKLARRLSAEGLTYPMNDFAATEGPSFERVDSSIQATQHVRSLHACAASGRSAAASQSHPGRSTAGSRLRRSPTGDQPCARTCLSQPRSKT